MPSWGGSFSKLLVASYILDWIVIIVALGVGAAFSAITPNERPFSLINTDISYPYVEHETIPLTLLAAIALLVPAVIIPIICLVRVPDAAVSTQPSSSKLRTKLWEWHVGWLGLALSLATAFVFTMGMKSVFGKPRPDLISRCSPDISQLSKFVVGGVGDSFPEGTNLVSSGICQRKDLLKDGFSSFPSGHSSFSFAGLGYLTLFICAKLRIALPMFPLQPYDKRSPRTLQDERQQSVVSGGLSLGRQFTGSSSELNIRSVRHKAAAPPIYLWFIAAIPVAAAVYVSGTLLEQKLVCICIRYLVFVVWKRAKELNYLAALAPR